MNPLDVADSPAVRRLDSGGARRRIVIVAPHFPPSNLAAVHRTRLFAQHLPEFGWEPVVVTVHHKYYEESLDWDLAKLLPANLRVDRVAALPTEPVRLIGDIGIRGFIPLLRRVLSIAAREHIDFLYLPVPSYYTALLGPIVHALRGIPYGIDYIDPWVHSWPGAERILSKGWMSSQLSKVLEPIAVRKAALITGVAPGYYDGVVNRNPSLREVLRVAMPYGGEQADHKAVRALKLPAPLLRNRGGKFTLVYAGAMLPRAVGPLEHLFRAIARNPEHFSNSKFVFIGTGKRPNDPEAYNIRPLAERFGLWPHIVEEHPSRMPYLEVLAHLEAADGVFILGSTEPHYTPSKVYQGVLSEKPILAVLHRKSTACRVLEETGAGVVLSFDGEDDLDQVERCFPETFNHYLSFSRRFNSADVDREAYQAYSARSVTQILVTAIERSLSRVDSGFAAVRV